MNKLKYGYGIVLDGLPDIPEFHFFVVFIFQKSLNMSGSQARRGSPHGPIEKEMCHLKAEKNKSFWMITEPDTFSLFCLLMYMYFLFIL